MKTEDMIKYGAIAVAAYLLYKWITSQSTAAITTTPKKELPAGDTPLTEIKDVTAKPVTTLDIYNAALSESMAPRAGSTKFSGHAWNWYRARAGENAGWSQADIDRKSGGTWDGMDDEITAAQYHVKLREIGLSGLGMAQSWGGGSMVYTN
jgi:hypothetical protein